MSAFEKLHPAAGFLWFAAVLIISLTVTHPLFTVIAVIAAVCQLCRLRGRHSFGSLVFSLFFALSAAILNPLFSHEGATILTYFPSGNPLTLESILYGLSSGGMLGAAVLLCVCFTDVMTSDKLVWLIGRFLPSVSMLLSTTLRFVPRFTAQFKAVASAQSGLGRGLGSGNLREKFDRAASILSVMLTWSLENALDAADSMKCRGWGLPGRSAYSIYRLTDRDRGVLCLTLAASLFLGASAACGGLSWRFYPTFRVGGVLEPISLAVWAALCFIPVIMNKIEDIKWTYYR